MNFLALLARNLGYLLMEFDHTVTINRFWGRNESIKFWGQGLWAQMCTKMHFFALLSPAGRGVIVVRVVTTI